MRGKSRHWLIALQTMHGLVIVALVACASALTVWPQPQFQDWPEETITYTFVEYFCC